MWAKGIYEAEFWNWFNSILQNVSILVTAANFLGFFKFGVVEGVGESWDKNILWKQLKLWSIAERYVLTFIG